MKILHQRRVSPPPNSIATTALPLTFLDVPFLRANAFPVQRLFFFEFPLSTSSFTHSTLPLLIHSLSLTLRHFFPFAANLILPPPPQMPHILYSDGDSLVLTAVESTTKFSDVIVRDARDVMFLHPFVPQLPSPYTSNGTQLMPIMAIQVTLFPNQGICIGVTFIHVAADGRSLHHFMKSWAFIHRSGEDLTCLKEEESELVPFHDRSIIQDPDGLKLIFLSNWWNRSFKEEGPNPRPKPSNSSTSTAVLRATFVLQKSHIDKLKAWMSNAIQKDKRDKEPTHMSTFVVSCAFAWVNHVRARVADTSGHDDEDDERHYFLFLADCRNRLERSIPSTYFGNCLIAQYASLDERSLLLGTTGILAAAREIAAKVKEMATSHGGLKGAERWNTDVGAILESGKNLVILAGSPRFRAYDTDFGWGRPKKSDVVHIDKIGGISLGESRDEEGGVEISLALPRGAMEKFAPFFQHSLESISSY